MKLVRGIGIIKYLQFLYKFEVNYTNDTNMV